MTKEEIIKPENLVYKKPTLIDRKSTRLNSSHSV